MSAIEPLSPPVLRRLVEDDLDTVAKIERRAYQGGWSRGLFRDCLQVGYHCWGLEVNGGLRGYGIISIAVSEAHLLNLCVDPAAQGHGYGRLLLGHLMALAREAHAECMYLEVRPSNRIARRLYASTGFLPCGRRPGYYPGSTLGEREDALVLRCPLTAGWRRNHRFGSDGSRDTPR